jgi:DNA-binding transcriptional LysR family regulator
VQKTVFTLPISVRVMPFYLLYPQNKHLAAKVRVLVDFLMDK